MENSGPLFVTKDHLLTYTVKDGPLRLPKKFGQFIYWAYGESVNVGFFDHTIDIFAKSP